MSADPDLAARIYKSSLTCVCFPYLWPCSGNIEKLDWAGSLDAGLCKTKIVNAGLWTV